MTPWKARLGQALDRSCGPMRRGHHTRGGFLEGYLTLWTTCAEAFTLEGLQSMKVTHAGIAHEEL